MTDEPLEELRDYIDALDHSSPSIEPALLRVDRTRRMRAARPFVMALATLTGGGFCAAMLSGHTVGEELVVGGVAFIMTVVAAVAWFTE